MKITKSQLREIIREELKESSIEPRNDHSSRKSTELDKLVKQFVNTIAKRYGYSASDAKFGITQSLKKIN
jgi:hypothetical protein